jgi:hypothetical protein
MMRAALIVLILAMAGCGKDCASYERATFDCLGDTLLPTIPALGYRRGADGCKYAQIAVGH